MNRYTFHVPNMNCNGCVTNIRNALDGHEGIENVELELSDKRVTIESTLAGEELVTIIGEAGYTAEDYVGKPGLLRRLFSQS